MKKILQNSITIIGEITILLLSIIWFLKTKEIEPLIGIVGSITFVILTLVSYILPDREIENKLGSKMLKNLDSNFLHNYVPGQVSIEKIIEDLGQPKLKFTDSIEREWDDNKSFEFTIYKYKFKNAVVWISVDIDSSQVIAISLISDFDKKHPILCPLSPDDEQDEQFGIVKFSSKISDSIENFDSEQFAQWSYSAITARYITYRPIKYLYFTYWNYNSFDEPSSLLDKQIEGVCVSSVHDIKPIIHFDDYLYN